MEDLLQILEHYKLWNLAMLVIIAFCAVKLTSKSSKFFNTVERHGEKIDTIIEAHEKHLLDSDKKHSEHYKATGELRSDVSLIKGTLKLQN